MISLHEFVVIVVITDIVAEQIFDKNTAIVS